MSIASSISDSGYRVVVLCGGNSSEREVSIISGRAVAEAVKTLGIPVETIELEENRIPDSIDPNRDLILPLIHGTFGEDGQLSAVLDRDGFAYAGCGMASSALCFDKYASKSVASRLGIPVARDRLLTPGANADFDSLSHELGIPFILKPRMDGSSVGLHLVQDNTDFEAASHDLQHNVYLAESYIPGYDLTVGILDSSALGVVGIHAAGGLYDYERKYTSGQSTYDVPADISEELAQQLRNWSELLFKVLGCRDFARVDYRISGANVIFLEINTIPGMTPTSLLPKSAQCMGFSFEELVEKWIEFCLMRKGVLE